MLVPFKAICQNLDGFFFLSEIEITDQKLTEHYKTFLKKNKVEIAGYGTSL